MALSNSKITRANKLYEAIKNNKDLPRSLRNITAEEREELLIYAIDQLIHEAKKRDEKIEEYQDFFVMMGKFMPYKNPKRYKGFK
jgi:hypothetical protein